MRKFTVKTLISGGEIEIAVAGENLDHAVDVARFILNRDHAGGWLSARIFNADGVKVARFDRTFKGEVLAGVAPCGEVLALLAIDTSSEASASEATSEPTPASEPRSVCPRSVSFVNGPDYASKPRGGMVVKLVHIGAGQFILEDDRGHMVFDARVDFDHVGLAELLGLGRFNYDYASLSIIDQATSLLYDHAGEAFRIYEAL